MFTVVNIMSKAKTPKKETKTVSTRLIMREYRDLLHVLKSSNYKNVGAFVHDAVVEKTKKEKQ